MSAIGTRKVASCLLVNDYNPEPHCVVYKFPSTWRTWSHSIDMTIDGLRGKLVWHEDVYHNWRCTNGKLNRRATKVAGVPVTADRVFFVFKHRFMQCFRISDGMSPFEVEDTAERYIKGDWNIILHGRHNYIIADQDTDLTLARLALK